MITFTREAGEQVRALQRHFEERDRPDAIRRLVEALETGWQLISTNPATGFPAPRPYPHLARPGRAWIKAGRYWIAFRPTDPPVIVGVFYDAADIPNRI